MSRNKNLTEAKFNKNDEFYTLYEDIAGELSNYPSYLFKDKVVYCNCDNPYKSNFVKYFIINFNRLGLKRLIATCITEDENKSYVLFSSCLFYKLIVDEVTDGEVVDDIIKNNTEPVEGSGSFDSNYCLNILRECDIVVSNPPFSLFRLYINLLVLCNKLFLILGNKNSITYKEIFPLILQNKVWWGYNSPNQFLTNYNDKLTKLINGLTRWYTNLSIEKRQREYIQLTKSYNQYTYYTYDNLPCAINVDRVDDIPYDYDGIMGVPITFLDRYNPKQFSIVGLGTGELGKQIGAIYNQDRLKEIKSINNSFRQGNLTYFDSSGLLNIPYARILIKKICDGITTFSL